MSTYSGTVTLIIGTHIAVIGARGACGVKTSVTHFLAGVALGARTGVARVERATSCAAEIDTVTIDTIVTGVVVIRMYTTP